MIQQDLKLSTRQFGTIGVTLPGRADANLNGGSSVTITSRSRKEHENLFASVDALTSEVAGSSAAGTDGPMLELLPHGSTFKEPVSVSFGISEGDGGGMIGQEPQEREGSVLLVLRQSKEGGPWLPLSDQESVKVDAQGKATVQLRSFSILTTKLFEYNY